MIFFKSNLRGKRRAVLFNQGIFYIHNSSNEHFGSKYKTNEMVVKLSSISF